MYSTYLLTTRSTYTLHVLNHLAPRVDSPTFRQGHRVLVSGSHRGDAQPCEGLHLSREDSTAEVRVSCVADEMTFSKEGDSVEAIVAAATRSPAKASTRDTSEGGWSCYCNDYDNDSPTATEAPVWSFSLA